MQLFYSPQISSDTNQLTFDKEESKHIIKVLRMKKGDRFNITNGKGSFFEAEIIDENPKGCTVHIHSETKQDPLPYHLHIAVAPTKLNDRYEWFLEKATEIGISEITPIICERSERKVIKPERYEKIIHSAVKQSLSAFVPVLHQAIPLKEFLNKQFHPDLQKFIAHCENTEKKAFKTALRPNRKILILIGPEGDFSMEEIQLAVKNGFIAVSLGNRRLRTETAAVVACNTVSFVNQDDQEQN